MLFNSYEFLYAFLPAAVLLYWLSARLGNRAAVSILGVCSAFFYAYWSPWSLSVLILSALVNFNLGRALSQFGQEAARRRGLFVAGISLNLLLISYFKYAAFLTGNLNTVLGWVHLPAMPVLHPSLLIGISFFTFTQIAFLVDTYQGAKTKTSFDRYFVFVAYFPHLIAGPILHYRQLIPQLEDSKQRSLTYERIGLALFALGFGFAKKVLLADTLAPIADSGFNLLHEGGVLSASGAWTSCLAYTLQIYFDFSGYCDMAVGVSLLFGIYLPVNFASPYKATSIIEFWRRWHITLSAFLREYVYIPLGGNRFGHSRRYINLLVTMLIGGLWHGANWTFVLWGLAHGILLSLNHLLRGRIHIQVAGIGSKCAGWVFTFCFISLAWVLFRSVSIFDAIHAYRCLFNIEWISRVTHGVQSSGWSYLTGVVSIDALSSFMRGNVVPDYSGSETLPVIGLALAFCLLTPPIVEQRDGDIPLGSRYIDIISKSPALSIGFGLATAIIIYVGTLFIAKVTPFIYFQF